MNRRLELEEQRDLALQDLSELEVQVAEDEIDEATAATLRRTYEADAAAAIRALEDLERTPDQVDDDARRTTRRRGLAAASSVAALVAIGAAVALPQFVGERPDGGFVTGNEAVAAQGRDLSEVTNEEMEQVVAASPEVVPMRLRLAHRYLDEGRMEKAFEHYMAVLDRQPHPEAMSHLAWIVFTNGEIDLALQLLEASQAQQPDDAETMWFLANVHLYGREDPGAALPLLEQLTARDDLDARAEEVRQALQDARQLQERP